MEDDGAGFMSGRVVVERREDLAKDDLRMMIRNEKNGDENGRQGHDDDEKENLEMRRVVVTLLQVLTKLQILNTPNSLKQLQWQVTDHQDHLLQLRLCQQQQTNIWASFPLLSRFPLRLTLLAFAPQ